MKTIIYLAQVSACTGIFYLFYHLVLSRLTFFTINRWYLLTTLLISFIIPLITISEDAVPQNYRVSPVAFSTITEVYISNSSQAAVDTNEPFDWISVLPALYFLVAGLLALYLVVSLFVLLKRINSDHSSKAGNIKLVKGDKQYRNGSFFNCIFINDNMLDPAELEQVIAHELVHIEQKHSIDKIISRLTQVILWFNPFAYTYSNAIEANHEYEVDRKIAESSDKEAYANLILRLAMSGTPFYNHFSKFPLSRRIALLFNKPTKDMKKIIYVCVVPLLVISCLAFANWEVESTSISKKTQGKTNVIKRTPPDTIKTGQPIYRQKVKYDQDKEAAKRRAWMETDEYKTKEALVKKIPRETFNATVGEIYQSSDKSIPSSSGVLITFQNDTYLLSSMESNAQLINVLKPGDRISLKASMMEYDAGKYVIIDPEYVEKDGKVVYRRKEMEIEPYAFLFEANRVRLSDCKIVKISNPSGAKTLMTMAVNGFTLNVQFDPSQTKLSNLASFKVGDDIRLRFVHEIKTGPRSYDINDWVCISHEQREREYGVQNVKLFLKFYEKAPVKSI